MLREEHRLQLLQHCVLKKMIWLKWQEVLGGRKTVELRISGLDLYIQDITGINTTKEDETGKT
jgi:hypothetical protein